MLIILFKNFTSSRYCFLTSSVIILSKLTLTKKTYIKIKLFYCIFTLSVQFQFFAVNYPNMQHTVKTTVHCNELQLRFEDIANCTTKIKSCATFNVLLHHYLFKSPQVVWNFFNSPFFTLVQ